MESPQPDIKRPKVRPKPKTELPGLKDVPSRWGLSHSPRVKLDAVKPRMAGAWSRCGGHTTSQPSPRSPRLKVFLKIIWNFRWMRSLNVLRHPNPTTVSPSHLDAGLAPGSFADEEETNSIPWTCEPFTGEVQLLPEKKKKSQKAKAGKQHSTYF